MSFVISKRNLVRIISFILAVILICIGFMIQSRFETQNWKILLENNYERSLGELSSNLSSIAADLEKSLYIGTPAQLSIVSARVFKESGSAKNALGSLPTGELHLDNTYRFLSQAGDFAICLSKKIMSGTALTEEEQQSAIALQKTAVSLRDYVDDTLWKYHSGQFSSRSMMDEDAGASAVEAGFENLNETVTGYPTLIYDGPFSDHLLNRIPIMTQNAPFVSEEIAIQKAAIATSLVPEELSRQDDENSTMPSYVFCGENTCIGVTKAGGYITYLLNGRELGEERLRQDAIFKSAEKFLTELGFNSLRVTYYEKADNICTINYAAIQNEATLYTDLIKVGVALDNGSIVFYDARGYLTNHKPRELSYTLTPQQASESVSKKLNISSNRLALIPTAGQNEVLTYEFTTTVKDNPSKQILVYVNANTGEEENILLLLHTSGGILTK